MHRWTGQSVFISTDICVKNILEERGVEGIVYKDGMPDFSEFAIGEVKIDGMTNIREDIWGQLGNYGKADAELAKIWSSYGEHWSAQDIQKWRIDNQYT